MSKLLISLAASMALFASGPALAQESSQQQGDQSYDNPAADSAQSTDYNDEELQQFVEAQEGINDIRDEYMEKIESADDQERAQELQMEANDEMVTVIEDTGLDIPTYNAIATAYNSEPDVRDRIDGMM